MSEPRQVGVSELFAFEAGMEEARREVAVILQELIADLRAVPANIQPTRDDLAVMADHYEQRLRELDTPE